MLCYENFNILSKSKLSSELNLIFIKTFLYSPAWPLCIVLIKYLISSQNVLYFINTSLFLFLEAKIKYLFSFFLQCIHLFYQLPNTKGLHCSFLRNQNFLFSYIQWNKYQWCFCMIFVCFSRFESNSLILCHQKSNMFDFLC